MIMGSLIMGNALSPLLSEIFMDNIEDHIHKTPFSKYILYWYRFVDDIYTCFTGTNRQLDNFLKYINSIHPKITFTMEKEIDASIDRKSVV